MSTRCHLKTEAFRYLNDWHFTGGSAPVAPGAIPAVGIIPICISTEIFRSEITLNSSTSGLERAASLSK